MNDCPSSSDLHQTVCIKYIWMSDAASVQHLQCSNGFTLYLIKSVSDIIYQSILNLKQILLCLRLLHITDHQKYKILDVSYVTNCGKALKKSLILMIWTTEAEIWFWYMAMAPHHLWIIIMIKLYIIRNIKITCTNTDTIGWRFPFLSTRGHCVPWCL